MGLLDKIKGAVLSRSVETPNSIKAKGEMEEYRRKQEYSQWKQRADTERQRARYESSRLKANRAREKNVSKGFGGLNLTGGTLGSGAEGNSAVWGHPQRPTNKKLRKKEYSSVWGWQ